ncbi:RNA-binding ASCH domain protein isoform 1 [Rhynchospora pubera]|uniref:RNA-binding ASCH domain protein isoform 1 n=1 Tax=Rhynchospora pubera TaxID=906938 RepID=A0AAV8GKX1_9POAL|nr:RNA-binding ASCH domain protein isoform 1 [Rhynchospora pubera]KAJ4778689.1 RNA-binding ASCH domain protein isoform 1 [Rhynchospora pubera]KAJ4785562.1 RNA-binding ASCH domain protein isoform 1 [Rhynchospora pubera]KAJ4805604.1 RNA-binding ASCH domain protein isoform 1 [Rhynchospora pubera]
MQGRGRFGGGSMTKGGYGGGSSGGGRGRGAGRYSNPCLTMHQPWASLLVYGIKRIEGRSWPSPITGRLWIHAASKVPEEETIRAMEEFYREIYAVNGITDIKFPLHYPVSRLLGCVEVVGCLKSEELVSWEDVPESVRLEGLTDFCWLCENPQRLLIPFDMRGYQGVYNLEKRIFEPAVRGLTPVQGPLPVKFPLPDPSDRFSLRPGSLSITPSNNAVVRSDRVNAAIAGARAAATQFSRIREGMGPTVENATEESAGVGPPRSESGATVAGQQAETEQILKNDKTVKDIEVESSATIEGPQSAATHPSQYSNVVDPTGKGVNTEQGGRSSNTQFGGTNKLLVAALRDLKLNKVR